ncbi:hypothetical protein EJB05_49512, partial [Eragrostis curvula]
MGRNNPSTPSIHAKRGRVLDPVEQNRLAARQEGRLRREARGSGGGEATARRPTHPRRRRRRPPPSVLRLLPASPQVIVLTIVF